MIELKEGQKVLQGVLVEFEEIKGKSKKDNKDFHFFKFNIDFSLKKKDGSTYTKLIECLSDPEVYVGRTFVKYQPVYAVFEILDPTKAPALVNVIQNIQK